MFFLAEDHAKAPGLPLKELENFLTDIRNQPIWRPEAARAAGYYDGLQLTAPQLKVMKEKKMPIIIHNLIAPTIDGVLGLEVKTRRDVLVRAEDEVSREVAEALNIKLKEARRLAYTDRAVADGFAALVKTGLGWVEVGTNDDPHKYRHYTKYIHRREIWWDWHAKSPDLSDARWLLREKWLDKDEAAAAFPQHRELIGWAIRNWRGFDAMMEHARDDVADLINIWTEATSTEMDQDAWYDSERDRLRVFECYYRVFRMGEFLLMPDGRVIPFDKGNKFHAAALSNPHVEFRKAPTTDMRQAYFIGPHRIIDRPSPHAHGHFPYVPFWGYREDGTGIPYGLIRRMMPAQDEINHRRTKLTWLLNVKRIIMDDDAVTDMSIEELQEQAQRADGVIILNKSRLNRDVNAFRIEQDFNIAQQQFAAMQDAMKLIQDTAGVYSAFLGQESGAKSGIAINSLVEQGTTTLADLLDNYNNARTMVHDLMLANIVADIGDKPSTVIVDLNEPRPTKRIVLNEPHQTEDGRIEIRNRVRMTKTRVVLDDMPQSAGYRQQITQRMLELAGTLPQELQGVMIDLIVESTDVPKRDEIVKRLREAMGRSDPADMTPEQKQAYDEQQARQQQQQKLADMQMELALKEMHGRVLKLGAELRRINAQASVDEAKAEKLGTQMDAQTEKLYAEVDKLLTDMESMRQNMSLTLDSHIKQLEEPDDKKGSIAA